MSDRHFLRSLKRFHRGNPSRFELNIRRKIRKGMSVSGNYAFQVSQFKGMIGQTISRIHSRLNDSGYHLIWGKLTLFSRAHQTMHVCFFVKGERIFEQIFRLFLNEPTLAHVGFIENTTSPNDRLPNNRHEQHK